MVNNSYNSIKTRLAAAGWDFEYKEKTGSTNDDLKKAAAAGLRRKTVLAAGYQTAGKGRLGRSFYSPADTGVYFSILTGADVSLVTPRAAVAAAHAISDEAGCECEIKWVNDIFTGGLKVCGILAESCLSDYIVVGTGINITTDSFPNELSGIAGCTGKADKFKLIYDTVTEFDRLTDDEILSEYRRMSMTVGRSVTVSSNGKHGVAVCINDDCSLTVRYDDGSSEVIRSGEVSVRPDEIFLADPG